ncbi:MAG: 3-oxoacyl-[acyl-carrier-protein] synthase II, partial [Planctomycetota bacterium]
MRDVVITGIGTLGVSGAGLAEFEQGLVSGKLPLTELDRSLGFHRNAAPAHALVVSADALAQWIQPIEARRLCRPSKFAVCATRMALADAGLTGADRSDSAWEGTAVVLGYCWGSTAFSQRLLRQVEDPEVDAVSPVIFMETIANSPAAKMAMAHGLKGPNLTLTQRETSDVAAIARGASLIASGRVERVVAGVTGEVSEALHAVLGGFGALTSRDRGRPLDARRDGVIAAEGATIFVLESAQLCEARGARVRARL